MTRPTIQDAMISNRDARIAELETALRELASSGIVLLEETSNTQERRTAQKRFRNAIANGRDTLLKGSQQ